MAAKPAHLPLALVAVFVSSPRFFRLLHLASRPGAAAAWALLSYGDFK